MDLLNTTGMAAGYTMGMEPSGRELLMVAVKGTFDFPAQGGVAERSEEQVPLIAADTFSGEPGLSAPLCEADYAPKKPHCDVILNGSAYAPDGKPVRELTVGLRVGDLQKVFRVVGDRVWRAAPIGFSPGEPIPFDVMPITYDRAFGGVDRLHPDEKKHDPYMQNPVGCGYHAVLEPDLVNGTPVPNTEESGRPISDPKSAYRPMSFGPVGRGWAPRYQYAGTYDDDWLENCFPFLPPDFDDRYYQCAPEDQQLGNIVGGEEVKLYHLTPEGRTSFHLPTNEVPVVFFYKRGDDYKTLARTDTLCIEPDARRLTITWRAHIPLRRNMFEISQVLVGQMSRAWWRARAIGKTYYPSIEAAVKAKAEPELTDE